MRASIGFSGVLCVMMCIAPLRATAQDTSDDELKEYTWLALVNHVNARVAERMRVYTDVPSRRARVRAHLLHWAADQWMVGVQRNTSHMSSRATSSRHAKQGHALSIAYAQEGMWGDHLWSSLWLKPLMESMGSVSLGFYSGMYRAPKLMCVNGKEFPERGGGGFGSSSHGSFGLHHQRFSVLETHLETWSMDRIERVVRFEPHPLIRAIMTGLVREHKRTKFVMQLPDVHVDPHDLFGADVRPLPDIWRWFYVLSKESPEVQTAIWTHVTASLKTLATSGYTSDQELLEVWSTWLQRSIHFGQAEHVKLARRHITTMIAKNKQAPKSERFDLKEACHTIYEGFLNMSQHSSFAPWRETCGAPKDVLEEEEMKTFKALRRCVSKPVTLNTLKDQFDRYDDDTWRRLGDGLNPSNQAHVMRALTRLMTARRIQRRRVSDAALVWDIKVGQTGALEQRLKEKEASSLSSPSTMCWIMWAMPIAIKHNNTAAQVMLEAQLFKRLGASSYTWCEYARPATNMLRAYASTGQYDKHLKLFAEMSRQSVEPFDLLNPLRYSGFTHPSSSPAYAKRLVKVLARFLRVADATASTVQRKTRVRFIYELMASACGGLTSGQEQCLEDIQRLAIQRDSARGSRSERLLLLSVLIRHDVLAYSIPLIHSIGVKTKKEGHACAQLGRTTWIFDTRYVDVLNAAIRSCISHQPLFALDLVSKAGRKVDVVEHVLDLYQVLRDEGHLNHPNVRAVLAWQASRLR